MNYRTGLGRWFWIKPLLS